MVAGSRIPSEHREEIARGKYLKTRSLDPFFGATRKK